MSGYESYIISIFKKEKVSFVREKTFSDLRDGKFRFDFYIHGARPIIIEVDGEQHFKPIYGRQNFLKG